ncbi:cytochrome b562 [Neisseriaceae bacterium JH1-16]|nr:cytochrome b562 [Neisseriaceae bacterium JH1-16]
MSSLAQGRTSKINTFVATVMLALLSAAPMAQAGPVKSLMKNMKQEMQNALNSNSMPEFSQHFARLKSDAQQASKQSYRSDQATYNEGMAQLEKELAVVEQNIQANNLQGAKDSLKSINKTKKHYHDLLG